MKLESVYISKFRSVKSVEVINCGDFNVLIGKNNSGKSNILSAINSFFKCIQDGNVIGFHPPIGKEIDFFKKETDKLIEITLSFSMSIQERDTLLEDITTEAPQMKNAVSSIEPPLQIFICITPPPKSFSFVSKISMGKTLMSNLPCPEAESAILTISHDAAVELYENLSIYSQQKRDEKQLSRFLNSKGGISTSRLRREWKPERETGLPLNYFFREIFSGSNSISSAVLQELENKYNEASSYNEFTELVQTLIERLKEEAAKVQEKPLKSNIDTFTGQGHSIPDYAKKLLRKVSNLKVLHLTEKRKDIGEEEAKRLLSLKVKRGGEEALRNIKETVSSLLGVRIDAFESDESPQTITDKTAELDVDNFLVELNGSGIKESLRLVLDVEFGNPKILLVEEPEIHLHPALETSMMRYLKRLSSHCQIFLTTHSTNFLDTAEMQNVYLISKVESTQVQKLNIEEAEAKIPKELGIRLSSLFMFDRLVFVEGQSDEDILREWASTLEINFSQANVGFIPMGGVRNFTHFATEKILSFLTKRQVKMWFLIDRDEKEDSEVSKLQNRLGQKAIIKVLNKREIENYLICSRAIREFIKFKKEASGDLKNNGLPTEMEIKEKIENCAEELKQLAINKRVTKVFCKPIYPSTNILDDTDTLIHDRIVGEIEKIINQLETDKERVKTIYQEQSELVNKTWENNKLNMVLGDFLINRVCEEYNVRFRKERDGSRLAAFMKKDEIDRELIDIITEIGSCKDALPEKPDSN